MYDLSLIQEILLQISNSIDLCLNRFKKIKAADDFLESEEGGIVFDAICMQLISIGESLKNLDKITQSALLPNYSEIDWKGVKGIRDIITHHYFDVDHEQIYNICKIKLPPLQKVITQIILDIKKP
jgi:uncharacterized protein with HEPN domain